MILNFNFFISLTSKIDFRIRKVKSIPHHRLILPTFNKNVPKNKVHKYNNVSRRVPDSNKFRRRSCRYFSARTATLKYICAECSSKLSLSRTDAVRCKDCGHRILLKARTKRLVQFEAR
ncbi:CNT_collapsed_G0024210.mRNA.1.CDS.1 [Saccharomyces cerevisiae]|nr:CNT_collapsed_G0024210.mRNA.1.CDS.1 [Saccharomyces cerevisiae]